MKEVTAIFPKGDILLCLDDGRFKAAPYVSVVIAILICGFNRDMTLQLHVDLSVKFHVISWTAQTWQTTPANPYSTELLRSSAN